ncbi:MAG TPA: segregation/condensation protein A [Betaproteobacteria bacterium]|jgi:segregation and condensation protein A|nr:segregation/condensation protein A [Betaproteobacteria bacterium]
MSVELVVDNDKDSDKQGHLAMEMPLARIRGEVMTELPTDLFIPPDALSVVLEQFEGPLDLLLYLIRKHSLDILDIPMADLTRQYMVYVEAMRDGQLELAAEYLLMAALLIEIKSRMLLPRPPKDDEVEAEDPRAELVRRLLEYEQMKAAALAIESLPRSGRDFSLVDVLVEQSLVKRVPTVLAADLTDAWRAILARAKATQKHRVSREELSVRSHMSRILRRLGSEGGVQEFVRFDDLFQLEEGVSVIVVSFLAVLELAREALIEITQTAPMEPIYVKLKAAEMPPLEPS